MMKKIFGLLFVSFLFVVGCKKNDPDPDKVYALVKEEIDIAYGDHVLQKMDIYFPEGYNQHTPVVFLIHGGGWIAGTKEQFTQVAKLFVAKGFVAVNLSHRLVDASGLDQSPPVHQASAIKVSDQVDDLASAVNKYKASASDWGVGISNLYMAGHSAGGTLAMLYVQGDKNSGVRASGNFAGLANLTLSEELYNNPPDHALWPAIKELLYRMSGAEVVHENALALMAISPNWVSNNNKPGKPNITVMAKSNDQDLPFEPYFSTIQDAEDYHDQLRSYGTNSAYILMNTDHGFGNHPDDWAKAVAHTVDFFKEN